MLSCGERAVTSFKQSSAGNIFFLHFSRFFFFWCLLLIRVANNIRASALPVVFSFFWHIHWWIRNFLLRACRGGLKIEKSCPIFLTYNPDFCATNAHGTAAKKFDHLLRSPARFAISSFDFVFGKACLDSHSYLARSSAVRATGLSSRSLCSVFRVQLQLVAAVRCKWTAHEQSATWCAPTTTTKKSYLFFVFF